MANEQGVETLAHDNTTLDPEYGKASVENSLAGILEGSGIDIKGIVSVEYVKENFPYVFSISLRKSNDLRRRSMW